MAQARLPQFRPLPDHTLCTAVAPYQREPQAKTTYGLEPCQLQVSDGVCCRENDPDQYEGIAKGRRKLLVIEPAAGSWPRLSARVSIQEYPPDLGWWRARLEGLLVLGQWLLPLLVGYDALGLTCFSRCPAGWRDNLLGGCDKPG